MIQTGTFWFVVAGALVLFWLSPRTLRYGLLAFISWVYLFWLTYSTWDQTGRGNPYAIPMLTGWVVLFYWLAPKAMGASTKVKRITPLLILAVLGVLLYFKYIPSLIDTLAGDSVALQIALPLGISYFTFKLIHYAVEVRRGNIPQRSFQKFACYMFLFPIFTAGPIERYDHFLDNLQAKWSSQMMTEGINRIIIGLIKQFVIAEMILRPQFRSFASADALLGRMEYLPTPVVWAFCFLSFLVTYMEFSAYSDIAIGLSRLFGIRIMENFNWPILATNIGDFWKRWHMTLAGWCQSYIYMPVIGITRNPYLAVYCTFIVMGLWHAGDLHWIMWGIHHATGIAIFVTWRRYRRAKGWTFLDKQPFKWIGIPITLLYVSTANAYTAVHATGGSAYDSIRILAKLLFIDLPA